MPAHCSFATDDGLFDLIDGIKLTPREIEVLACLICGQKVNKQISFILSIAQKTSQIHISNILKKMGYTSREQVIDWLKQSEKQQELIEIYNQTLLPEAIFKEMLEKFPPLLQKQEKSLQKKSCLIIFNQKQKEHWDFLKKLNTHLSLLGIKKISCIAKEQYQSVKDILAKLEYSPDICLCIVPQNQSSRTQRQSVELTDFLKQKKQPLLKPIFLLLKNSAEINLEFREYVDFSEYSYYLGFFHLIKKVWMDIDVEPYIQKFQQTELLMIFRGEKKSYTARPFKILSAPQDKNPSHWYADILKQGKNQLFIGVFLCLTSILSLYVTSKEKGGHSQVDSSAEQINFPKIIHSTLIIPGENTMLFRPKLIQQIEEKFRAENNNSIIPAVPLVCIVGMGGVGKTTLARYYALTHKYDLVWQINAETETNLMSSLKSLAYSMARTKEQKNELLFIEEMPSEERGEKLAAFVTGNLKNYPKWLLIFDNVETILDIKKFLPDYTQTSSRGNVLVTTRNDNIQNTSYIRPNSIIKINELSHEESLDLFSKIYFNCPFNALSWEGKKQALDFIKNLAKFPLDISVAAHYVREIQISFQEYFSRISNKTKHFEQTLQHLIKEKTGYDKSRYSIVSLTLDQVIEPDFKSILFMMCILDSQEMPKELFDSYASYEIVDRFIRTLKSHSLIAGKTFYADQQIFSIHRITQDVLKAYMNEKFTKNSNEQRSTVQFLIKYR